MNRQETVRRKALEALGWTIAQVPGGDDGRMYWRACDPDGGRGTAAFSEVEALVAELPAIESDPAISEPSLDQFCKQHGWIWQLAVTRTGYVCVITDDHGDTASEPANEIGKTPSEARAKAIVTAAKYKPSHP